MPRILVLVFEDTADATSVQLTPPQGAVVLAEYMVPTKFCECNNIASKDGIVKGGEFIRGAKYGLYVHKHCKLPAATHLHYPKNLLLETRPREGQGLNLSVRYPYTPYHPFGKKD